MTEPNHQERGAEPAEPSVQPIMLALFDVLGFSKRVETQPLMEILAVYRQLIKTAVLEPARRCLGTVLTPEGDGRVMTLFVLPVRYAYFSDTIMLWVPLERVFAAAFVTRCADLMCEAVKLKLPLRGAITLGEAVMHQATHTYLGKPIVEAANLEKGQDWIGLTLGWSATWPAFIAELDGPTIIEYPAPVKAAFSEFASPVVVDWPRVWRDKNGDGPSNALSALNTDASFSRYYDNAVAFAGHSEANHDWFRHPETIPADAKLRLVPYSSRGDA